MKANEIRNLNSSIDSLKSVNEELKVMASFFRQPSAKQFIACF